MKTLSAQQKQLISETLCRWDFMDLMLLATGSATAMVKLANNETGPDCDDFEDFAQERASQLVGS